MRESMTPDVRERWAALLPATGRMSMDELMALPEHRWRYELIAGALTQRPSSDLRYDLIQSLLTSALRDFARTARVEGALVNEVGVMVSAAGEPDTVFVPAVAFTLSTQVTVADGPAEIPSVRLIPEFVAEIAAPGQERQALAERARAWLAAGVRTLWVIWPARRQVDVWRAGQDAPADVEAGDQASAPRVTVRNVHDVLDLPDVLPGFTYPAAYLLT